MEIKELKETEVSVAVMDPCFAPLTTDIEMGNQQGGYMVENVGTRPTSPEA